MASESLQHPVQCVLLLDVALHEFELVVREAITTRNQMCVASRLRQRESAVFCLTLSNDLYENDYYYELELLIKSIIPLSPFQCDLAPSACKAAKIYDTVTPPQKTEFIV